MRVLIHALGADMGGAIRHLRGFLPELAARAPGDEFTVLVRGYGALDNWPENVRPLVVPPFGFPSTLRRLRFDSVEVPKIVREGGYDGVVSLTNNGPFHAGAPHVNFQRNSLFFCPYFMQTLHGNRNAEVLLRRWALVRTMRGADAIVVPTKAMADMVREAVPEIAEKTLYVVRHGLAAACYDEPLSPGKMELLHRSGPWLVYPTHVAVHKGIEILFPMLAHLTGTHPDATLFLTFSEEDWPSGVRRYKRQIARLGLERNIVFLGRVPQAQMGNLLRRMDLMVYPSLCESFGFSLLEGMAFGLPIVAAGTAVNRELSGDAAIYYEPMDPEGGARAVRAALVPETGQQMKERARLRMEDFDWGWGRYVQEFLSILGSVLSHAH